MPTIADYIAVLSGGVYSPSDSTILSMIELATFETSDCYKSFKNKAIALLVLHWKTLIDNNITGGLVGSVSSLREGDLAKSFNNSSIKGDEYLSQTSYGLELIKLKRGTFMSYVNRTINEC